MDLFRMLAVYLYGGFYADMDMLFLKPLDALREHPLVLGEEKTLTGEEMQLPHHKQALRIANYMFGSVAGHPFLINFVKRAIGHYGTEINKEHDVLETTGPGILTNFYHEQKSQYPGIHLLHNSNAFCLKRCSPQPSCHFGDYAVHQHTGSWRWQHK
jgi:mannosyltransferase OCH1-like enzyme